MPELCIEGFYQNQLVSSELYEIFYSYGHLDTTRYFIGAGVVVMVCQSYALKVFTKKQLVLSQLYEIFSCYWPSWYYPRLCQWWCSCIGMPGLSIRGFYKSVNIISVILNISLLWPSWYHQIFYPCWCSCNCMLGLRIEYSYKNQLVSSQLYEIFYSYGHFDTTRYFVGAGVVVMESRLSIKDLIGSHMLLNFLSIF